MKLKPSKVFLVLMAQFILGCGPKIRKQNFSHHLFQTHCTIFDIDSNIKRTFPFNNCSFASDGSFVALKDNSVLFYNNKNEIIVEFKDINPHHDIFRADSGDVYILGSRYVLEEKKYIRKEVIYYFSSQGKLLNKYDFSLYESSLKKYNKYLAPNTWVKNISEPSFESTHANSIHQFKSTNFNIGVVIQKGDLLVNIGTIMVLAVFEKDLSRLKHILPYEYSLLHDVRPLETGEFAVFLNRVKYESKESSFVILDNEFKKIKYEYKRKKPLLNSESVGSIEFLDKEHFLMSENRTGKQGTGSIVNMKDGSAIQISQKYLGRLDFPVQSIRWFKNTDFLKNNSGL